MDDSDVYRKKRALELGLLETASYAEINDHNSDVYRKKRALELGLLETASYADINNHNSCTNDNTYDNTNKKFN
jgi:hypothetical protein